jgi:superfamily I DNA and/or RNA helicase/exoribonuclease R
MLVDKFAPVCFGNHGPAYKKGFVWMTKDSPHIIVRPTPFNVGRMLERSMNYRCNHSYRDCYQRQRNVCIFPHNQTEEKWWNRWKTKRIDEISLTGVARQIIVKARRKRIADDPAKRAQLTTEVRSKFGLSMATPECIPSLKGCVARSTYKTWFRTLLFHEMKYIEERLHRLNGLYPINNPVYSRGIWTLSIALSDQDIEFVIQNAPTVTVDLAPSSFSAVPARSGSGRGLHLRIALSTTGSSQVTFSAGQKLYLLFNPDFDAYWTHLHSAVEKLSPSVVSMLIPLEHDFIDRDCRPVKHSANSVAYKGTVLELDVLYQKDALECILRCPPGLPFLLTGPFGTGKTRLLARLADEVLNTLPKSRVLICVHHIRTADSYLDSFFGKIVTKNYTPIRLLKKDEMRPSEISRMWTPEMSKKDQFYKKAEEIGQSTRLIISTNTATKNLLGIAGYKPGDFTHILIDEAAQCIEPEAIIPLLLAGPETRIVLAGDHMQVGAEDQVKSREGRESGLGVSLLKRLHSLYCEIEKESGVAKNPYNQMFRANLLSNYRCDPGILRLPSNLFYESSLLPQVTYEGHPDFSYPLAFVCTSMDISSDVDEEMEVKTMVQMLMTIIDHWPLQWKNYGDSNAICLIARSYRQINLIRRGKGQEQIFTGMVTERSTFGIQGSEFTAVLLCTAESTRDQDDGNIGRSLTNPRVFNTILTRSRALFLAIGNPFHLLKNEEKLGTSHCWREYLKRCVESNSITFPAETVDNAREELFTKLFVHEESHTVREPDAILEGYEEDFRSRLNFSKGQWSLVKEVSADNSSMNDGPSSPPKPLYTLQYLSIQKAEAVPFQAGPKFVINGINARRRALHGATVEIDALGQSSANLQSARVTRVVEQSKQTLFLCKMDEFNSSLFIPLDGQGPKFVNLPPISRQLLQDAKAVESALNKKKNPVACFDIHGLEKGIPRLKDIVPFEAAKELIFLVRFIEWRQKSIYPMAVVIDIFPPAHSLFHARRMLSALNSDIITNPPKLKVLHPIQHRTSEYCTQAITVDADGSCGIDDALSVIQMGSTRMFRFTVHVTDVCSRLTNEEVKAVVNCGRAVFFDRSTVHSSLLPENNTNACTLRAGKFYSCFSLTGEVRINGVYAEILEEFPVEKLTVCIKRNYTYESAHVALSNNDQELRLLYSISKALRRRRLGVQKAWYMRGSNYSKTTEIGMGNMMEEFTIWANSRIVEELQRLGSLLPLRVQADPSDQSKVEFERDMKVTNRAFLRPSTNCEVSTPIVMTEAYLNTRRRDRLSAISILSATENYPQLVVRDNKEQAISQLAEYTVVDSQSPRIPTHWGTGGVFTHFTSPLWRGFDVMVQALLLSQMNGSPQPFSETEVKDLAETYKQKDKHISKFENRYKADKKSVECFHNSFKSLAVVVFAEEMNLKVKIPTGPMSDVPGVLSLFLADLAIKRLDQDRATWRFKVFSLNPSVPVTLHGLDNRSETPKDVIIHKVPLRGSEDRRLVRESWHLESVAPSIPAIVLNDYFTSNYSNPEEGELHRQLSRVYSDHELRTSHPVLDTDYSFYQVEVTKTLRVGDLVSLWIGCNIRGPTIQCEIQSVQPVPFLNICVQHIKHPSQCFSSPILHNASRNRYSSVQQYIELWEEVQLAETAQDAPTDNESDYIYFQNVALIWPTLRRVNTATEESHYVPEGEIFFVIHKEVRDRSELLTLPDAGDFICAQYEIPQRESFGFANAMYSAPPAARAAYHFVVVSSREVMENQKDICVRMKMIGKLNAMVSPKMYEYLRDRSRPTLCTLQLIVNSLSNRRLYSALRSLQDLSIKNPLVKSLIIGSVDLLALGPVDDVTNTVLSDPLVYRLWGQGSRGSLNEEQKLAISGALRSDVYLIQGPPGTGKSETGAHLAYAFVKYNHIFGNQKCVLYCGPSNKSVNVVLEKLHSLMVSVPEQRLKILRIYNRVGELVGRTGPNSLPELYTPFPTEKCPPDLLRYTLHQRVLDGPYGDSIRTYEEHFATMARENKLVPEEDKVDYRKIRSKAEDEIFQEKFDIILCTCNEAAGEILGQSQNRISNFLDRVSKFHDDVIQCIIDECAMATEVETMAVIRHANRVVLIGDHKQLQPVLKNRSAKDNGLGRSLFEKYAYKWESMGNNSDREGCFICLKEQYRMHTKLCQFPSTQFYDGNLRTAPQVHTAYSRFCSRYPQLRVFWPRPNVPTVFYNVQNGQESYVPSVDKARLESKCNKAEAARVIRIAQNLVSRYNIKTSDIAVLTPYNAQKTDIADRIEEMPALSGIKVRSITDSQGSEFPIVILSLVRTMREDDFDPELVRGDLSWLHQHLGFVTIPHQICVGITRCKFGLIIVGNSRLLSCDPTWSKLIAHYRNIGCMR